MVEFVGILTALENYSNVSWFMPDGACPYRTSTVFDFLNEHFSEHLIDLDYDMHAGSDMARPPYSLDLMPSNFFLWGYLKNLYTANLHKQLRS